MSSLSIRAADVGFDLRQHPFPVNLAALPDDVDCVFFDAPEGRQGEARGTHQQIGQQLAQAGYLVMEGCTP